jgi:3-dehydroquinate synthase
MDPEEAGYRRILNFGHTIAHALESLSNYQISHGEAVAIGCMAESFLSHKLDYLPKKALDRILELYRQFDFSPEPAAGFGVQDFFRAMALDKKAKDAIPRFVLIDQIGHCVPFGGDYCARIAPQDFEDMIHWMQHE